MLDLHMHYATCWMTLLGARQQDYIRNCKCDPSLSVVTDLFAVTWRSPLLFPSVQPQLMTQDQEAGTKSRGETRPESLRDKAPPNATLIYGACVPS